jgi:RNA ligase
MVLNYTRKTLFEGKWNSITKMTRGLIVKGGSFQEALVIARPWGKFFSLEQTESGWATSDEEEGSGYTEQIDIDYNSPVEVTDKIDGSMLVLYKSPAGLPALATRGSFSSKQALVYTNTIRMKCRSILEGLDIENTTFIFEGIGPSNRIVLKYSVDEIIFLGATDIKSGEYLSPTKYSEYFRSHGIKTTDVFPASTLSEAIRMPPRQNAEGVVVRYIEKRLQFKIKQEDYLELHRSIFHIDNIRIWEMAGESDCEPIDFSYLSKDFQEKANAEYDKICKQYRLVESEYIQAFEDIKKEMTKNGENFGARKDFALRATKNTFSYILFALYDGKKEALQKGVFKAIKPKERIALFWVDT